VINNTEGAILIQLLFQFMRGKDSLNDIFYPLLDRVRERSAKQQLAPYVKKHILGVYLSAVIYNN